MNSDMRFWLAFEYTDVIFVIFIFDILGKLKTLIVNNGSHKIRPLDSTFVYVLFGLYVKDVLLAGLKGKFLI